VNIIFTLNGEEVSLNAPAIERLSTLLHDRFGLSSVRAGCLSGRCGSCLVLIDGKLANACLVPAFKARKSSITTFEHFSKTKEYADIEKAFQKAGVETCGFCLPGKALSTENLIGSLRDGDPDRIAAGLSSCVCRCTELPALVRGVALAMESRRERDFANEP
jgi:aerobic-type carbon monoxide dehydrogenase small subunit (CoxS/CutS family)